MAEPIHCIIPLDGHGVLFKHAILRAINHQGYPITDQEDLDYIYQELINQIFLIIDREFQDFCIELATLPELKPFAHLPYFDDRTVIAAIANATKEFAILLYNIIIRYLPLGDPDLEILIRPEGKAEDYLVLMVITNNPTLLQR